MGLFSKIAGIIGGGKGKKASRKAEAAQIASLQQAIEQQNAGLKQVRTDFQPFVQSGQQALGAEANLLGLNGNAAAGASIDALKSSPLFASLFETGEEAILANASATGGIRGGNTQGFLADFGRDTLASVIENQLTRLGRTADRGLSATGGIANAQLGTSNNISQLLGQQGDVRASGLLTRGGISGQQFSSGASLLGDLSSFLPSKGIGGFVKKLF